MKEIRIHGRGGQGGKTAARIIGRAAFINGKEVQDFAKYGMERRGAPVTAFCRVSENKILKRGYIDKPDVVIILDETLLDVENVSDGLSSQSVMILNSKKSSKLKVSGHFNLYRVDGTNIALEVIGKEIPNVVMCGAFAKITDLFELEDLEKAIKTELGKFSKDVIKKNIKGAREAYKKEIKIR